MKIIRIIVIVSSAIVILSFGYSLGRFLTIKQVGDSVYRKVFNDRSFIDLERNAYPNDILKNFYRSWKNKRGYAAFREVRQGFDGFFYMYWITENGQLTVFSEDNTTYFPKYIPIKVNNLMIGYEDPNKTFVEIELIEEPQFQQLKLKGS